MNLSRSRLFQDEDKTLRFNLHLYFDFALVGCFCYYKIIFWHVLRYLISSANLVTWLSFWTEMFFKNYCLTNYALFIGEECVSDATNFKLLCLLRLVLGNVLDSFPELCCDPLEKTASNRQVSLWYSFLF